MEAKGLGSRQWATLLESQKSKLESNMFVSEPSKLAQRILLLVGWGLISANCARWLAEGAVDDGLKQEPVKKLAELGAKGQYPGNCRRDLFRFFCPLMSIAPPIRLSIPCATKRHTIEWVQSLVVNPLAHMETLYRENRKVFNAFIGVPKTSGSEPDEERLDDCNPWHPLLP